MAAGKQETSDSITNLAIAWARSADDFLNNTDLARAIDWFESRTVAQIRADAPGFAPEDDAQIGRMREAVLAVKASKDSWNADGKPPAEFFWGAGR
jgi:hypothetical protein